MAVSFVPSIVPNGHDQIIYPVINNYGKSGTAFSETDVGEADLETTAAFVDGHLGPDRQLTLRLA